MKELEKCVSITTLKNPLLFEPRLFVSIYIFRKLDKKYACKACVCENVLLVPIYYEVVNSNEASTILEQLIHISGIPSLIIPDCQKLHNYLNMIFEDGIFIFNNKHYLLEMKNNKIINWGEYSYICTESNK